MKIKQYAEVTQTCVNVFTRKQAASRWDVACFALPINEMLKSRAVVLLANTSKATIRVVDMPKSEKIKPTSSIKNIIKQITNTPDRWELVKSAFPIGEKMNENTHIFDGTMVTNENGDLRFYMTALPVNITEEISQVGIEMFGKLHKLISLDTVEHILFRYFSSVGNDALWVIFPQEDGFRILYLTDGMPRAAWHVNNAVEFREGEILRYLQGSKNFHRHKKTTDTPSLSLVTDNRIFTIPPPEPISDAEEIALNKVVVLNTNLDLGWLYALLIEQGLEVEKREYLLSDYL